MGSFRLKLVAASVLVSGAVLAGFALFGLSAMRRIGLERIDRELQALGDAQVRRLQPPGHWAHFGSSLSMLYGGESTQYFIRVSAPEGRLIYASPHWPGGLDLPVESWPARAVAASPDWRPAPPDTRPPPPGEPDPENEPPAPRMERQPGAGGPPVPLRPGPPRFLTRTAGARAWRVALLRNEAVELALGVDLAGLEAEIARVRNAAAVAAPLALLALAAGGWWLASQALRPVRELTRVAGGITARDLSQRVAAGQADREFRALIEVINGMLERLERSFRQATRFSADAAHELKTPLTILQGHLEQALQSAPSAADQQRMADLLEEVQRLTSIVRKLLLLAQADSGQLRLSREPVDLSQAVEDVAEDIHALAPGLALTRDVMAGIQVPADPDLLRQVLHNLVMNAVKYNREGGSIDLRLHAESGRAILTVSNTTAPGARIDPNRLFERFYRGDAAHGRRTDGLGLGLSLSREIARAHQGDLILESAGDGKVTFAFGLPTG